MRAVATLSVALALAGCAAAPAEPPRRAVVSPAFVTLAEQDALIQLERGALLHIRLEADRTSKRRWQLASIEGGAVAAHGSPWYASRNAYAQKVPGNWIFDFDAVAPGSATVRFAYRADGEPVAAAERTAAFDLVVR